MSGTVINNSENMRIVVFGDKGYATSIIENLISRGENIVGICCRSNKQSLKVKLKEFVRLKLIDLGIFWKDSFSYKEPFEGFKQPRRIAHENNIPVLDSEWLRTPEFETALRNMSPDLILVAGFHRLIPQNIIKIPKIEIINFHPSLLPRHRGGTPNRWVIRNGEEETGITAHLVNEEFDCGDVVLQDKILVKPDETWGDLELRINDLVAEMVYKTLEIVKGGKVNGVPQKNGIATCEPSFRGKDRVIDWCLSPVEIKRTCYAIRPKSGGLTKFKKNRLCIWDIVILSTANKSQPPGTIIEFDKDGSPVVTCGGGMIKIILFLYSGKVVKAEEIVVKYKMRIGMKFENIS